MRVPQVNERVKEAPAQALRAMFGGIGSLLSVTDKLRNKTATMTAPETTATAEEVPDTTAATADATPTAETVVAETTAASETTEAPETTGATETAPAPEADTALPLANYDDLSVASLRARLRNLSAEQLGTLIEYEKGHAGRADVIAMFERRIAKLAEA